MHVDTRCSLQTDMHLPPRLHKEPLVGRKCSFGGRGRVECDEE